MRVGTGVASPYGRPSVLGRAEVSEELGQRLGRVVAGAHVLRVRVVRGVDVAPGAVAGTLSVLERLGGARACGRTLGGIQPLLLGLVALDLPLEDGLLGAGHADHLQMYAGRVGRRGQVPRPTQLVMDVDRLVQSEDVEHATTTKTAPIKATERSGKILRYPFGGERRGGRAVLPLPIGYRLVGVMGFEPTCACLLRHAA